MKNFIALALALSFTAPAFAAKPVLASLKQLVKDAQQAEQYIGAEQDCGVSVEKIEGGIRLSMTSKEDGTAWLIVKNDSKILLTAEGDDDWRKLYVVPGQGTFEMVNMDDAYFHAYLTSHGKKISCELDF